MDLAQFEGLVSNLMSGDNSIRQTSEVFYQQILQQEPDKIVVLLLQLGRASARHEIREMCVILLRQALIEKEKETWRRLSMPTQALVKTELLKGLEAEQHEATRDYICDTVAELGAQLIEESGIEAWPELLPAMFRLSQSPNPNLREAAYLIFSDLSALLDDAFLKPYLPILKNTLNQGLNDEKSVKVRVAALMATATLVAAIEGHQERAHFLDLTPAMLQVVSFALSQNNHTEARSALQVFVDLAEQSPSFFRPNIIPIADAMIQLATSPVLPENIRNLGLEFLLTLAESSPALARKIPNFLQVIVPLALSMMVQLEDIDLNEWNRRTTNEGDVEGENSPSDIGGEALDRLALALKGKILLPVIFQHVSAMLNAHDWKQRYAALIAISMIGEGCMEQLVNHLEQLLDGILPRLADPHPRVRYATCQAIGQMCSDFGLKYHQKIVPALIASMHDQSPRVQAHAACAVINFCDEASPEIMQPYLEPLLSKLANLLQMEQALTALAAVADCIKTEFAKYYDIFMPYLKSVLVQAKTKEYRMLRGKAMECVSLMALAVGKEKFAADAPLVLEEFAATQRARLDDDDPQASFLIQAWARLCKTIGRDFIPYLPLVMPPLLEATARKPELTIIDGASPTGRVEEEDGWEYIPAGDSRLGIKTAQLEEKSTAANMLYWYAEVLADGFFPYVDQTAKIMVPLLKYYPSDGVRLAAHTIMPYLLISVIEHLKVTGNPDRTMVNELWNYMYPTQIRAMAQEPDAEILGVELESFKDCLAVLQPNELTPQQAQTIVELCVTLIKDFEERRQRRYEKHREDMDEEIQASLEAANEKEEDVIGGVALVLEFFARLYKQNTIPYVEPLVPIFLAYLHPERRAHDIQIAICFFDDMLEHGQHAFLHHVPQFLPAVLSYMGHKSKRVRQAAVYGIGWMGQVAPQQLLQACPDVLKRLFELASHPQAREEEHIFVTENAIAAIGRIIRYCHIDQSNWIPMWFSLLPVTTDDMESKNTYDNLCHFIETKSNYILGTNYEQLPKALAVMADALGTQLVDEKVTMRFINILRQLQANLPQQFNQAVGLLQPPQQEKIAHALNVQLM